MLLTLFDDIDHLRYQALGTPETRQVGAWQSFEVTAMTKLREASRKFMSSHQMPSDQELELIDQARTMIVDFTKHFDTFIKDTWIPFEAKIKEAKLDWNN